jgi:hypothetical protein
MMLRLSQNTFHYDQFGYEMHKLNRIMRFALKKLCYTNIFCPNVTNGTSGTFTNELREGSIQFVPSMPQEVNFGVISTP